MPSIAVTAARERSSHSFFFAKTTPMNDSRSTNITNLSISNLVNSHFLDERWFDFHFLDNDFHFLNNRYGQARLRMHFLDNAFCALMSTRPSKRFNILVSCFVDPPFCCASISCWQHWQAGPSIEEQLAP